MKPLGTLLEIVSSLGAMVGAVIGAIIGLLMLGAFIGLVFSIPIYFIGMVIGLL
jgi:predicted branched-subunit amino acid permease